MTWAATGHCIQRHLTSTSWRALPTEIWRTATKANFKNKEQDGACREALQHHFIIGQCCPHGLQQRQGPICEQDGYETYCKTHYEAQNSNKVLGPTGPTWQRSLNSTPLFVQQGKSRLQGAPRTGRKQLGLKLAFSSIGIARPGRDAAGVDNLPFPSI